MPTFTATLTKHGTSAVIIIPFAPAIIWGERPRYHITGTVNTIAVRGALTPSDSSYMLKLGPAWLRDCGINLGSDVTVTLDLEGPHEDNVADDIVAALKANPVAKAFFDGLPTFYRKKYLRWIDGTKGKPDVRAQRIAEMITLLAAGQRER
ncbi:MAG: YdeI/OmpD-associated family protein [Chloroflexi bacterium]|nr:YdeI/OmpD-associated family protein [Chloroflexota bacterium]